MRRVRAGDQVIVITGRDKGKQGKILRVLLNDRVIVENINMLKHYDRSNPAAGKLGGITEKEGPIHISNVMLYNSTKDKGDRIGFKRLEDTRKVRYFKSNGEIIDI